MSETKKRIRPGAIEVHPEELALVVNYEVQEVSVSQDGSQNVMSTSAATKRVAVKALHEGSNLGELAKEVVDKCKLIHPSKVQQIEGLLRILQQRAIAAAAAAAAGVDAGPGPSSSSSGSSSRHHHHQQQQQQQASLQPPPAPERPGTSSGRSKPQQPPPQQQQPQEQGPPDRPGTSGRPRSQAGPAPASPSAAAAASIRSEPRHTTSAGASSSSRPGAQRRPPGGGGGGEGAAVPLVDLSQSVKMMQASALFESWQAEAAGASAARAAARRLGDLDDLLEGLYEEDLGARGAAAGRIALLFRDLNNFEELLGRETLIATLARVLREDGRRHLELATCLTGAFWALSLLAPLHRALLEQQVGTTVLELVELELQRTAARTAEEGPGAAPAAIAARAAAAVSEGGVPLSDRERKLALLVGRQDRFLQLGVGLLGHLAEDASVERKMRKKGMVPLLVPLLSRPCAALVVSAANLLRKLSVVTEHKERMASCGILPPLLTLLAPGVSEEVAGAALRLAHNLSFDTWFRGAMARGGFVPRVVELLAHPSLAPLALGLAYHLSMVEAARPAFVFSDALPKVADMLLRANDLRSVPELIALAVNLSLNPRVADWFVGGQRVGRLLRRALATGDQLAFKLLRNLVWTGGAAVAGQLVGGVPEMVALLRDPGTGPEAFLEVLGVLAATVDQALGTPAAAAASGTSLSALLTSTDLLGLAVECLAPGVLEEDALLEALVLAGALAGDEEVAAAVADSGLLLRVASLMAEHRSDDEMVVAAGWAVVRGLGHEVTRRQLMGHTQVVMYMVDLLNDAHPVVRKVADACLDAVSLHEDEAWATHMRTVKFESVNQDWLQIVQGGNGLPPPLLPARPGAPVGGASSSAQEGGWGWEQAGGGGGASMRNAVVTRGGCMLLDIDEYAQEGAGGEGQDEWGMGGDGLGGDPHMVMAAA